MMHTLRVILGHARIVAVTELAYRSNFWTYLLAALGNVAVALLGLALVFDHVDELGGWSHDDLVVVVGVYVLLGGVVNGVIHASLTKFAADVRQGTFDFRLLKPVDAQLVTVTERPDPWRLIDVPVGVVIAGVGLGRGGLGDVPGGLPGALGAGLAMLAVSLVIIAAFWLLVSCLIFWTIQGEGILWALDDLYYHLRWPIDIFPPGLRVVLMSVFPAGLAVTVPAQALTGRATSGMILLAIAVAGGLCVASRLAWRLAVRRYEGASS